MPKTIKFIKKKPTIYYQVTTCQIIEGEWGDMEENEEWFGADKKLADEEFLFYVKAEIKDQLYSEEDRLVYLNMAEGKEVTDNGQEYYEWECVECFSTKERRENMKKEWFPV